MDDEEPEADTNGQSAKKVPLAGWRRRASRSRPPPRPTARSASPRRRRTRSRRYPRTRRDLPRRPSALELQPGGLRARASPAAAAPAAATPVVVEQAASGAPEAPAAASSAASGLPHGDQHVPADGSVDGVAAHDEPRGDLEPRLRGGLALLESLYSTSAGAGGSRPAGALYLHSGTHQHHQQHRSFLSKLDVRRVHATESKSSENLHREQSLRAEERRGLYASTDRSKLQHLSLPPPGNFISLTSPGGSDRRITILSPHSPLGPTDFAQAFAQAQNLKTRRKKPPIVLPRKFLRILQIIKRVLAHAFEYKAYTRIVHKFKKRFKVIHSSDWKYVSIIGFDKASTSRMAPRRWTVPEAAVEARHPAPAASYCRPCPSAGRASSTGATATSRCRRNPCHATAPSPARGPLSGSEQ
ncbi:unnamed protein product [Trichogramma brassicae]|uniref:Uncharacterized protein n=1 Tax=Trichogramma brassicae TaxID=86971 RepID=A0A6H5I0E7_9HYME|nr:unnamed protein product [Trichogramma brassicae]